MTRLYAAALILAALFGGGAVEAGELKLSTIRIDLDDDRNSFALVVTNASSEPSLVQFRPMAWSQAGAADTLTVTRGLIANPPFAEIGAGAAQVVRVGYIGKKQAATEGCFRLLVEEVPKKDPAQSNSIATYLTLSVPIFVAPLEGGNTATVAPTAVIGTGPDGKPSLMLHNAGARHLRLTEYHLVDAAGADANTHHGLFYVLPEATISLPLSPDDHGLAKATAAALTMDSGAAPLLVSLRP
jgi:fimbrial chaperone protein